MFLLDTMVISEPRKPKPDAGAMDWLDKTDRAAVVISAISLGEIAAGIEKKRQASPIFSGRLDQWFVEIRALYVERTLPVTVEVALRWGSLYTRLGRRDMDLLIAATALEHDLTVVTRNTRHFEPTGAKLLNPYET